MGRRGSTLVMSVIAIAISTIGIMFFLRTINSEQNATQRLWARVQASNAASELAEYFRSVMQFQLNLYLWPLPSPPAPPPIAGPGRVPPYSLCEWVNAPGVVGRSGFSDPVAAASIPGLEVINRRYKVEIIDITSLQKVAAACGGSTFYNFIVPAANQNHRFLVTVSVEYREPGSGSTNEVFVSVVVTN